MKKNLSRIITTIVLILLSLYFFYPTYKDYTLNKELSKLSGQDSIEFIDKNNQELIDRLSIEGTPILKFYCKYREIGEHIGYAIEPILKQKIEMFLSEMEFCIKNSTPLPKNIQDTIR